MLGSCLSFLEESRLKYESKDFEQLKVKTGDFLEHGALGNIRVYCEMLWPYTETTKDYLSGLAKADVRKALITFLYNMCRGKGIETTRATEQMIGELWEFGRSDKVQERDMLQALVWDTGMFIKNTCYWDWEEMREIGESDPDVVRKLYESCVPGKEGNSSRISLRHIWKIMTFRGDVQLQIEQLEVRLLNYPSQDREEDRSIKNSFQLQNCVRWIQELSAAYYTLPAKAYRNLSEAGVWKDYVVPRISQYESMSCYEVVSDILRHVEGLGEAYKKMMKVMGKEHIKSAEIPGRYDWQYLREAEPAFIEPLAIQKGLYFGEALDTFYESRFALALEQGRERHGLTRAEMLAEYLEYSEP